MRIAVLIAASLLALPALAQEAVAPETAAPVVVPQEQSALDGSTITLHVQPFLDATELATLRLVATNAEALALFVPSQAGFAALAAAPEEGFVKEGAPVASAIALSDLPDAATAAKNALESCDAARTTEAACVLLLEIGPKS